MSQDYPLLKQAQELQRMLREMHREFGERQFEGSAGGGVVRCVVTGHLQVQSVKIDPAIVDPENVRGLEELVTVAVRQAVDAAREVKKAETDKITGGILPDLGF